MATDLDLDRLEKVYVESRSRLIGTAFGLTRDRELAADLVQEAFARVAAARSVPSREDELLYYVVRALLNLARNRARRDAVARSAQPRLTNRESSPPDSDLQPGLFDAVMDLPRRQKEVIFLRFWLDMTYAEAAKSMGVSTGAAKTHQSRAMDRLRRSFGAELDGC